MKGAQTNLFYVKSPKGNAVALVVFRLVKKEKKDFAKILDASDAVTVEGTTFRPWFIGRDLAVEIIGRDPAAKIE